MRALSVCLRCCRSVWTLLVFFQEGTVIGTCSVRRREEPLTGSQYASIGSNRFCSKIETTPVRSSRNRMPGANVYDVKLDLGGIRLRLYQRQAKRVSQALRRVSAGPQMPRNWPKRDIKVFGRFPGRSRHVAILALLLPETSLMEILAPLQEGLGLFTNHALANRVTVGAHRRTLNRWL